MVYHYLLPAFNSVDIQVIFSDIISTHCSCTNTYILNSKQFPLSCHVISCFFRLIVAYPSQLSIEITYNPESNYFSLYIYLKIVLSNKPSIGKLSVMSSSLVKLIFSNPVCVNASPIIVLVVYLACNSYE